MTALEITGLIAAGWLLGMATAIVLGLIVRKQQAAAKQAAMDKAVIEWARQHDQARPGTKGMAAREQRPL